MAEPRTRRWTDPRDGVEWEILYNPSVELDTRRDRAFREKLVFRSEAGTFDAPAVFGSDLETLQDRDLQGLLDGAKEAREGRDSPWS